jgi:hypothetical protein
MYTVYQVPLLPENGEDEEEHASTFPLICFPRDHFPVWTGVATPTPSPFPPIPSIVCFPSKTLVQQSFLVSYRPLDYHRLRAIRIPRNSIKVSMGEIRDCRND